MKLVVDSGFLFALFNLRDPWHRNAEEFVAQNTETLFVPNVVLPEVCYLITRDFGHRGIETFLDYFAQLDAQFAPLEFSDLQRVRQVLSTYADAELDIVDCCIIAIAERLDIKHIATFDRRDFSLVRPRHGEFLELLP